MKSLLLLILVLLFPLITISKDYTDISFNNQMVDAANIGDIQTVINLSHNGYSVDSRGLFGATPLIRAANNGNIAMAKELIARGADPSCADFGGATALHFASRMGHKEIAELLIKSSPSLIEKTDNDGWTPLMRATNARNISVIKLLLEKGADPLKRNKWQNSSIDAAVTSLNQDVVKVFIDKGILAKMEPKDKTKLYNYAKSKNNLAIANIFQEAETKPIIVASDVKTKIEEKPVVKKLATTQGKKIDGMPWIKKDTEPKPLESKPVELKIIAKKEAPVVTQLATTQGKKINGMPWIKKDTEPKPSESKPVEPKIIAKKESPVVTQLATTQGKKINGMPWIKKNTKIKPVEPKMITNLASAKDTKAVKLKKLEIVELTDNKIKPLAVTKKTKNKAIIARKPKSKPLRKTPKLATIWLEANIKDNNIAELLINDPEMSGLKVKVVKPYLDKSKQSSLRVGPIKANQPNIERICAKISSSQRKCRIIKEVNIR